LKQRVRLEIQREPTEKKRTVSFAGLMDEKGKYLIEKHPIQYLSAGRDLIRISQDSTQSGEFDSSGGVRRESRATYHQGESEGSLFFL
jgi:hypothetical protein